MLNDLLVFDVEKKSWARWENRKKRLQFKKIKITSIWKMSNNTFDNTINNNNIINANLNNIHNNNNNNNICNRAITPGNSPVPRYHHSAVVYQDSMFIFGQCIVLSSSPLPFSFHSSPIFNILYESLPASPRQKNPHTHTHTTNKSTTNILVLRLTKLVTNTTIQNHPTTHTSTYTKP